MENTLKLAQVKKGVDVVVQSIEGDELRSKLLELGITSGCNLRVLYTAPFGDPIAIDVEGFVLSLRKSEANLIQVTA
jgi:ferrous iron transport protein A